MENEEISSATPPVPTEFGRFLRIERMRLGMKSGKKMAEALGITTSLLSEIENGKREQYPDIDFILRCRDFFGWKIEESDSIKKKKDKNEKTVELFEKGLASCDKLSINMNIFRSEIKPHFIKMLIAALFLPDLSRTTENYINISFVDSCALKLNHGVHELIEKNREINTLPSPPPRKKITRKRKEKPPLNSGSV